MNRYFAIGLLFCLSTALVSAKPSSSPLKDSIEDSDLVRGEDYIVIEKGDTLSRIAEDYLGRRDRWPTLWSYNAHITNPHTIYPGDILYLKKLEKPSKKKSESQVKSDKMKPRFFLSVGGFVKPKNRYVGRIVGSSKRARMLAEHDEVWIDYGESARSEIEIIGRTIPRAVPPIKKPDERKKGKKFAIIRDFGPVENIEMEPRPRKFKVLGAVELTDVKEDQYDLGVISKSWQEIQRGDLLVEYQKQRQMLEPVPANKNIYQGMRIIDNLTIKRNHGTFAYVFVNRGSTDGVRRGNRLFVYEKLDGLRFDDSYDQDKIPWSRIGQIMVIKATDNFSTGVIVNAKREIEIGDRLEMYQGF